MNKYQRNKLMEEAEQIRKVLKEEESYFKQKYDFEVRVHGTKQQGYNSLWEFMDKGNSVLFPRENCYKCGSKIVRKGKEISCSNPNCYTQYFSKRGIYKKAHEYWTFLMFLNYVLEEVDLTHYEKKRWIRYEPSQGDLGPDYASEYAAVSFPNYSIFVEPALPDYDKETLYQRYRLKLSGMLVKSSTKHVKPDFLILRGEYSKIGIPPIPQDWLIEFKKVEYQREFNRIKRDVKWVVECKNEPVTEEDISQFLWYAIAYRLPTVFISQFGLNKFKPTLENTLEELKKEGIICCIVENFKIGEKETDLSKVKRLLS